MPAPIQFTTADDGARIAYCDEGAGLPLVYMPPLPLRHVELEWHLPEDRRWIERLTRGRRLIRFDPRGLGLSDRSVRGFALDDLASDLASVVDAAGADRVALLACVNAAPTAVRYAIRHRERVSHLMLWSPVARMADSVAPQIETLLAIAEKDWELFTETVAHVMVGWERGDSARRYAEYLRACVAPELGRALIEGLWAADVTRELGELRVPVLVLHRRGVESIPLSLVTEISARIAGARMVVLDGNVMRPGSGSSGDIESAACAIDAFLGDVERGAAQPAAPAAAQDAAPAGEGSERVFRREGEFWTLVFDGHVARLRDAKGLHHIARLLREPNLEIAAAELAGDGAGSAASLGDAGPRLDAQAKAAYKARLIELRAELDEALRAGDVAGSRHARAELEALAAEVSAAVGLHGDRKASSDAERARLTATKRIKDAIARIATSHPALGRHLGTTIHTGHLCSYRPDTDTDAGRWSL